jgi:hypothetical protein
MGKQTVFKISDEVYLKTGYDKERRIVTRISVYSGGRQYELSCGTETSWHYSFEITKEMPNKHIPTIKGMRK